MGTAQTIDTTLWVTNDAVNAVACDGRTIYIGGNFNYVGPPTGGGVAIDSTTGAIHQPYSQAEGSVLAVAFDGSGGWYLGGNFSTVGGQPRSGVAHLDADGNLTDWNPDADGPVYALEVAGGTVYAGGTFRRIGGESRSNLAALDATTGAASSWNPGADAYVSALVVSGGTLYVGGGFTNIAGQTRSRIAALDVTTGVATTWDPSADRFVYALAVSGDTVYAGGGFTSIGGQARSRIAALDVATGAATNWNPNADDYVNALEVSAGTVYAGGDFTSIGGQSRGRIAALDPTTGAATNWNPNADGVVSALAVSGGTVYAGGYFGGIGGHTRRNIAALDATTGAATSWNPTAENRVLAVAVSGGTVYVGGWFTSIGGQTRRYVAALDATTGVGTSWNPNADGYVNALAMSKGTVYVGGSFASIGGQKRSNIAALDATTGAATSWNPNADGPVSVLVVSGDTVYAGGGYEGFGTIGGQKRSHIAALDATTGDATSWDPHADDAVNTLLVSGNTIYAGGWFSNIGGQTRGNIAALDATTGAATSWNPQFGGLVSGIAACGGTVYIGGGFTDINGQTRTYIAALDSTSGAPTHWNPGADDVVNALVVSGGTVYVGGEFTGIGGLSRSGLAALDATIGAPTSWNPVTFGSVYALAVGGGNVYVGGGFYEVDGQPRQGIAAFRGVPIVRWSSAPLPLTVTIGDTDSSTFTIRNIGLDTLTISSIRPPSPTLSIYPDTPLTIPPGAQRMVSVRFHPVLEAPRDSAAIRITSDDPYTPEIEVPVTFEALGLEAQTQALFTGDRAPLGQAITIQVVPVTHIERGTLYYRPIGETAFIHVELGPFGSTFIGIVPGEAVREGGLEYYVELENSGVFATDPRNAPDDSLFKIAVAVPTSIAAFPRPTSRSDFLPDSTIAVEVALPVGAVFSSGSLHYRRGGEVGYVSAALAPGRQVPAIGTIPGTAVGPRGVEYWVEVQTTTSASPLTFPVSHPEATPDSIRVTVKGLPEPNVHPGGRYRMLGLPLDFGREPPGLGDLLSSQLGRYDPVQWRAFRYHPDGLYIEDAAASDYLFFRAVPGRAFWLISRGEHRVDTGLQPGLSTSTGAEYPVALAQGWNQIANPFDFRVAWASVRKPAGVGPPVAFDPAVGTRGDYKDAEFLEPFEGYFVFDSMAAETLWLPPAEAPALAAGKGVVHEDASAFASLGPDADDGWRLRLRARTEHAEDGSNVIGVAAAAADGRDGLDRPKPPCPPGAWVRLGFRLPGDPVAAELCRADLRASNGAGHAWEIELRSVTAGEPITLEALWAVTPPDGLKLMLIDRELGSAVDLGGGELPASYRLLSPGPDRGYRLTLLAGSDEFVARVPRSELAIPSRLVIDLVVPNPSRAALRIRYGLPRAQTATIEIMDVLGRRVTVLHDRAWQNAGYHALLWDGLDHLGKPVPSGIYFCRLSSGDGVLTRRIVRLD